MDTITLKIMTFNIRFDNPEDGAHSWAFRKERVIQTILHEMPDLLGTQEVTAVQMGFLDAELRGYRSCVPPRLKDSDPRVQFPTIFYRLDRLAQEACGEFWLSETPEVHRSKSWGAAFPRLLTFGRFRHRPSGKRLWFGNTHLDHVSGEARLHGAQMIHRWSARKRVPVILTGDFNELPDGPVHRLLTGRSGRFRDTWRPVPGSRKGGAATVHHFTGKGEGERIDWILASHDVRVDAARILDRVRKDELPSDHFPYVASVRL
jgi:endonuclease/exonuclease/phosphatase family metal-dependent hydrolase